MMENENIKKVLELGRKGIAAVKDTAELAYKRVVDVLDQNGNGALDIEDLILMGMKMPGVKINRAKFLTTECSKICTEAQLERVKATNLIVAGIAPEKIDELAEDTIRFERACASGATAVLGLPGGAALAATLPIDIAQYYGCLLRTAQKLMYLYGFPEIDLIAGEQGLDAATMNTLILCMGVMYGVREAGTALTGLAKALGRGVSEQLLKTALTQGTLYTVVQKVLQFFAVNLTKEMFAGFFEKSIPVAGSILGAGITFVSFKPCCDRLKKTLREAMLDNPNMKAEWDFEEIGEE